MSAPSDNWFRTLVETIPDALFMTDAQGRITLATSRAAELLGFDSADELMGRQGTDFLIPEDRGETVARLQQPGTLQDVAQRPARLLRKDGSAFSAEVSSAIVRDDEGQLLSIVVVARDVTERERAEQAVRQSEAKYRALVENTSDIAYSFTADGKLAYVGPQIERYGYPPEKVLAGGPFQLVVPEDRDRAMRSLQSIIATGEAARVDFRITGADGQEYWLEAHSTVLRDASGAMIGISGTVRDITDRKRAEEALLESERRFREVTETVPAGIEEIGLDGRIQYVNAGYCKMFGIKPGDVEGTYVWQRAAEPEKYRALFQKIVEEQPEPAPVFAQSLHESRKPIDIRVDWDYRRDERGAVMGVIAIITEITAQKTLETQLRQAQKMEAIGTLAGGVAHDFNNLLTPILGYADILSQSALPGSRAHEAATVIKTAALRASTLAQQLLGFARKGKLLDAPVDMHQVVSDTVALLSRTMDRRITISLRLEADRCSVTGDPSQLEQVVMNLAVNARDAMPNGGELTFHTGSSKFDEEYCRVHSDVTPGSYLILSVSDTGTGMSKEVRQRVFEPFFTTKREGEGTGMGLAMVYGIVKNHGGAISVYSEVDSGTTFKVLLPLGAHLAGQKDADEQKKAAVSGMGTVLVVDDEEGVRQVVESMLTSLGYRVVLAENGQQGILTYKAHGRDIDLVILDLTMPVMDGQACFSGLVELDPKVKVLIATGHALNDTAQTLLNAGAIGFVQKPFVKLQLSVAVAKALTGDVAHPPADE